MQVDTEALLDSVAVSHVVGVMEATRLLQAWKQRVEKVRGVGRSVALLVRHPFIRSRKCTFCASLTLTKRCSTQGKT